MEFIYIRILMLIISSFADILLNGVAFYPTFNKIWSPNSSYFL